MPEFAQFRAITQTDTPITLTEGTPTTEAGFIIKLPGLDPNQPVIVMFKVSGRAGSHLIMHNDIATSTTGGGGTLIDFVLDSTFTKPRSWHEIAPGNQFSSGENKFLVKLSDNSAAGEKINVSDIVLL